MAKFETFDRDIKLATEGLAPEAVNVALAKFARSQLRDVISSGQASTTYERYVNGRRGVDESSVIAPGPILYEFTNWPLVVRAAIAELVKRSPKRSGRYAAGFMVLANGAPVRNYSDIGPDAEVIIFNVRPYTRKIEVGANKSFGKKHFDASKRILNGRFRSAFRFEVRFLDMPTGLHPLVPYSLKRSQGKRKSRQAGNALSYPALVMNVE